eukprot:TRINITY_DN59341_c0_g1_i1.p1 TRINITY_DN59341_c0_g1~~TRINITY_DN59341_c0_g1_i1.p1  ORF type:complete len:308 (+),score=19.55 TRINITY_DN59341_c0_g1_i1:52-924(+)
MAQVVCVRPHSPPWGILDIGRCVEEDSRCITPPPRTPPPRPEPTSPPPAPTLSRPLSRRGSDDDDMCAAMICLGYLKDMPTDPNDEKFSYLLHAVSCGDVRSLRILLDARVEKDADRHCAGWRPLHQAVSMCRFAGDVGFELTETLLVYGSNPSGVPGDQMPPIFTAAARCSPALDLLLRYGANACQLTSFGQTPLHLLSSHKPTSAYPRYAEAHRRAVVRLLESGVDPLRKDNFGLRAAQFAVEPGVRCRTLLAERAYCKVVQEALRQSRFSKLASPLQDLVLSFLLVD